MFYGTLVVTWRDHTHQGIRLRLMKRMPMDWLIKNN
jgi:hypothetical protein